MSANAILCQKHLQLPQRSTQYGKLNWLNVEQLLVPQGLMCQHQQGPWDGPQAGMRSGRALQQPFSVFLHQIPWKCLFPFHRVSERQFGDTAMGVGELKREQDSMPCAEGDRASLGGHGTQTLLPKEQIPKSCSHWRCCLCTSSALVLLWELFCSPTFYKLVEEKWFFDGLCCWQVSLSSFPC